MLRRKMYERLVEWKTHEHKCLVLSGQRQVGKTYIIREFAKDNYEHFIEINLDVERSIHDVFKGDRDVDSITAALNIIRGSDDFEPGSTLLFLDEIQTCPEAYSSLKQFTIDGRYDVIASGSMLGVDLVMNSDRSPPSSLQPVGYVDPVTMYSLDFEEFLWARGISDQSISYVKDRLASKQPLGEAIVSRLSKLFSEFMVVGGMPEAVQVFVDTGSINKTGDTIHSILDSCIRDINAYNDGNEKTKTLECFLSIPAQLSETNSRFEYSRVGGSGTRRAHDRYRDNLLWIKDAGYGNFCYSLTEPRSPLATKVNMRLFKVYLSDTGMLTHMADDGGDLIRALLLGGRGNIGFIMENAVAECIMKCGRTPYYYRKSSGEDMMELDFVLSMDGGVGVLEVKSGKTRNAPSLKKVSRFHPIARRIMLEQGDVAVEDGIEHYPLFAIAFLDSISPPMEDYIADPSSDLDIPLEI